MEEKPFVYKKRTYKRKKKKVVKEERVVKKKRILKEIIYYATYVGTHKHIVYAGIGRVMPGKEYLIKDKEIADSLRLSKNWKNREHYIYEDIK